MIGATLALLAIGAWAALATVVVVRRDGYRAQPTRGRDYLLLP